MSKDECMIKLSDIPKLIQSLSNKQSLDEQVKSQPDNDINILLNYQLVCIKNGTKCKENISIDQFYTRINQENFDNLCKIIKTALQIQADSLEATKFLNYLHNQKEITIICLKLMNILLDAHKEFASIELLHVYLNLLRNENEQNENFKYFISYLLPKFFKHCDTNQVLETVCENAFANNNLFLIASIPNEYLLSSSFLTVVENDTFSSMIIEHIQINEGYKYKVAMHLLTISLELLKDNARQSSNNFIITQENVEHIFKAFEYFCILIDVTREKQLHLIEPSLDMLTKINNLPNCWINLIYKKLLCHAHNTIAYYGAYYLIKQQIVCEFVPLFTCLNKSDDSKLCKQIFKYFETYCINLKDEDYNDMMEKSLSVKWNPVAFYKFYKNSLVRPLSINLTLEIIKVCKQIPHKYIRQGLMLRIFMKLKIDIGKTPVNIEDYIDILLEFMADDAYYKYATKLINIGNLQANENFMDTMNGYLIEQFPNRLKIDLIIEVTERKNLPESFIKSLYSDFKARKYGDLVLDRLSYLYLVKASDLHEYLMERLSSPNESYSIRHMDKPNYDLVAKSITILLSNNSHENQIMLAMEILYYSTNSYTNIYTPWFKKILGGAKLQTTIAINFLNLLIKIPTNFGKSNFETLLQVYVELLNSQDDETAVRIFRNFDFVLENAKETHIEFLNVAYKCLLHLKSKTDFDNATRYLVRSIALNYKTIEKNVLDYLLKKLYSISDDAERDSVIYYTTMYFKYLNVNYDCFPMYRFLLYPDTILNKTERAEYEICTEISLNLHGFCPYFRSTEIRKWVLEDLLFDNQPYKIVQTVNFLLDSYGNTKKRYFPDSSLHLQKLRIMQIFAFLLPVLTEEIEDLIVDCILESFAGESHQMSVRVIMQYLLIQLLKEREDLNQLWTMLDADDKMHNSTLICLVPVLYGLHLHRNNAEFSQKVIEKVLVWTMGPMFKLRFFAQKLIYEICHAHRNNFKFKRYDSLYNAVRHSLQSMQSADNLQQHFNLIEYVYNEKPWKDPKKLLYVITIYIPEITNVPASEWEYFKIKHAWGKYLVENLNKDSSDSIVELPINTASGNIQKKMIPWQAMGESELVTAKSELILVASLVESPANLGGLSRTCEIFGVQLLVVSNAKIFTHKEFTSLSMSSERWLPVTEVKDSALADFLKRKKEQGYQIIGVEQTCDSESLDQCDFQLKTVLLLGNERSGIPANLVSLTDKCVEIPQYGMIRSLNVHVAGALVVWEYTRKSMVSRSTKL